VITASWLEVSRIMVGNFLERYLRYAKSVPVVKSLIFLVFTACVRCPRLSACPCGLIFWQA